MSFSIHRAGFALLVTILFGACAAINPEAAKPEATRTKNLLAAAGFHTRKPENPAQREIFSSMPPYALQGGLIHGKQLYVYKDPVQGAVYIGGETEYQQYERLLAQWKKSSDTILGHRKPGSILSINPFGDRNFWLNQSATE